MVVTMGGGDYSCKRHKEKGSWRGRKADQD